MFFSRRETEIDHVSVGPLFAGCYTAFGTIQAKQSCHLNIQGKLARNARTMLVREAHPVLFAQDSDGALVHCEPAIHLAADVANIGRVFAHRRANLARAFALLSSDRDGLTISRRKEPGGAISRPVISQIIRDADALC